MVSLFPSRRAVPFVVDGGGGEGGCVLCYPRQREKSARKKLGNELIKPSAKNLERN